MTFSPTTAATTAPTERVSPRDSTPETPCRIDTLGGAMRDWIAKLGTAWVEGEITEWNVRNVGTYAKLRDIDGDATISIRVWSSVRGRIPADLKRGDRVIACVKPEYWVKGGDLSFVVSSMRHVGLGDLLEKLERLRAQLRGEGLFDDSRKQRLPFLPQRIGLITGKNSDAEKDVLRNAQLRWPSVEFEVRHAAVQGDRLVPEVLAALAELDADPHVDVIVIARGGGDFQHLLGFSDERLLRAVAAASTPIVSAIGHENDRPLLDEVADLRASTPTDAAKRVVPDVAEQLALVRESRARLTARLSQRLTHDQANLEQLRSRPVLREPERMLRERDAELEYALSRGRGRLEQRLETAHTEVHALRGSLRALSPRHTLERGYAIVHLADGAGDAIVRDADAAPAGTELMITLARGTVAAQSAGERQE